MVRRTRRQTIKKPPERNNGIGLKMSSSDVPGIHFRLVRARLMSRPSSEKRETDLAHAPQTFFLLFFIFLAPLENSQKKEEEERKLSSIIL